MARVSVVITAHNYGRFLSQAIDSVLNQTFDDFELIVVDDGSTDHTAEVLGRYTGEPRLSVLSLDGVGLAAAANAGIRQGVGEYVIRLDADDYFDENILLILVNVLDRHPEYGMVYPDYYRVNKYGDVLDQVRQQKVNDEVKLLDRSCLAAGAMYRRSCYDALDGYNEDLRHQEDYDFWIRFIDRYHVHNVRLPLMYYRQHSSSMSTNQPRRMAARRYVKRKFAAEERHVADKEVLCVLPAVADNRFRPGLALEPLGGAPMLSYMLAEARRCPLVHRLVVDTEDPRVADLARELGAEVPDLRPRNLAKLDTPPEEFLRHLLKRLKTAEAYVPDVILMGYYNHPFVRAEHLEEAVNTLAIYDCDSVISVGPNIRYHWQVGEYGLTPVLYPRGMVTDEKWVTYEERGGVFAFKPENLLGESFLGHSVSYIELASDEGLRVDSDYHLWIAEQMLETGYWETRRLVATVYAPLRTARDKRKVSS